ncbi:DNA polymerase III subunit delta' [Tomitella fengzijianii]|uniref:DNA polymerase III subunit delta n=1 Tax=Tomitella fengzijianii TaxID=2597660 RepID=A0A516X080_9ACTN|nr:DNA polymerase III subunit delta' [Tomitella fengzijianii]QDQ96463.1 DNA polymerase III subunit delta' [Tomitella fengzijianii]
MVVSAGSVFDRLVGQDRAVATLAAAASAARGAAGDGGTPSGMTHSWLFTGPPGSGRSIAALAFAAALQCTSEGAPGCGECSACRTALAGTHGDVRRVVPEGLSIPVKEMRAIVQIANRRPSVGRWLVVVVEDADRLTEGASNALLKVVEEPPERTVFLLCAPSTDPGDVSVTIRSRCRHVGLVQPPTSAVAQVLRERDGLDEAQSQWAASVSGGHVGRARWLARDEAARARRLQALRLPTAVLRPAGGYLLSKQLVDAAEAEAKDANAEREARELDELRTALGAGGTGKGTAGTMRGTAGLIKDLEKQQKTRRTRSQRDALDRALMDVVGLYRDALAVSMGSSVPALHPDLADDARTIAREAPRPGLLQAVESVLECREALSSNVKPQVAMDAMIAGLEAATRR